jgi:hypothetical protein
MEWSENCSMMVCCLPSLSPYHSLNTFKVNIHKNCLKNTILQIIFTNLVELGVLICEWKCACFQLWNCGVSKATSFCGVVPLRFLSVLVSQNLTLLPLLLFFCSKWDMRLCHAPLDQSFRVCSSSFDQLWFSLFLHSNTSHNWD